MKDNIKIPKTMWATAECARCGSEVPQNEMGMFHCPECADITFPRAALTSVVERLEQNFEDARNSDLRYILEELFLFGEYAEGKERCRGLNVLVTYDRQKFREWCKLSFREFTEELCLHVYEREPAHWNPSELTAFLDEDDFFDFRECRLYPKHLPCYGAEDCALFDLSIEDDAGAGREARKVHNFCIEICTSHERYNGGVPSCCEPEGVCPQRGNRFQEHGVWVSMLEKLAALMRKETDLTFERDGRKVKMLDFHSSRSIRDFTLLHEDILFKFIKLA